jgi:nucleotide-binding universal stress UspA family protein
MATIRGGGWNGASHQQEGMFLRPRSDTPKRHLRLVEMKKILIAVDDTKGTKNAFSFCENVCSSMRPEKVSLLYVEKFEGRSLMDEMLGEAEMVTLKDVLEGTEYQEALDKKARAILDYYKKALEDKGVQGVKTIIKKGHPAEEILKTAMTRRGHDHYRFKRQRATHLLWKCLRKLPTIQKCLYCL